MKKKILYIESNTDGTIGGSYYSLLYLLEGLNKERYEPYVLFCQDNILIPKFKEVAEKVMVYDYEPFGSNPFNSWKVIPKFIKHIVFKQLELHKIIHRVRPDLVHLNNTYAANHEWMLTCYLHKIKVVAHDRNSGTSTTWQTRLFVRFLDAIISVSETCMNFVTQQGLKPKRIRMVYNGLNLENFEIDRSQHDRMRIRENLGIAQDSILVGMVGNICYLKGQLVFVKAIDLLINEFQENKRIQGIIIGNTPTGAAAYEQEIRSFLKERKIDDKVRLLGYRQDIPQLLKAVDIFVHASVELDALPRVILEAMALEKPVIATNSGGASEIIEDWITGYLVPMNDQISMKNAIMRYVQEHKKAKAIGVAARKTVEVKFSVYQMVQGVEEVYEEIFRPWHK